MVSRLKSLVKRAGRQEKGQAFILVLILLLVGGLIIAPLLAFMGTGLKSGQVFERKTNELYAADSGIEDGIWQIKYDELASLTYPKAYTPYDYNTQWEFVLDEQINSEAVSGTIENVWIPKGYTIPGETQAQHIIEGFDGNPPKVMVNGNVTDAGDYRIRITYNRDPNDTCMYGDKFQIEEIGIWLPAGFEYVADSSNLEADPWAEYYSVPVVSPHAGGQAVVWSFSSVPMEDFPGVGSTDIPMITDVTFEFTARRPDLNLEAMSWVNANFDLSGGIGYTWDADTKVYRITSEAGDTGLEAHTIKSELRELGGAISGDYFAFGNTLLAGDPTYRDRLYEESTSSVVEGDIPESANIDAAYLYWSGWIDWHGYEPSTGGGVVTVFYDGCGNLNNGNWDYDNDVWHESGSYNAFYVHNVPYGDEALTLHSSLPLAVYADKAVTISWQNWVYDDYRQETGDCFQYAFYSDSGGWGDWQTTWCGSEFGEYPEAFSTPIPAEYLTDSFKMRFRAQGFSGSNEYCYLDEITITVSTAVFYDDCSDFSAPQVAWSAGSDWSVSSGAFMGHHSYSGNRYLTMAGDLDLSAQAGENISISWEQWTEGWGLSSYDRLYFAFSGDGGGSWSSNIEAFRGSIGGTQSYSYPVPQEYLTDRFRLRFYLEGFDGSSYWGDEECYIDNIAIFKGGGSLEYPDDPTPANLAMLVEETARVNTVMFNGVQVTADEWHVLENENPPGYSMFDGQWSYSCFYDATDLVEQWIEDEDIEPNGVASYTVGHVVAVNEEDPDFSFDLYPTGETGYPLATPSPSYNPASRYQAAYAGWSLILIYSSVETKGHQLYLYDDLIYAWHADPDFDENGSPGGSIGGFLVPDPVAGETLAAQITAFVGEGDYGITGDYMKLNNHNLSNGASPVGNVWNSASPGVSIPGVDIDTFDVTWESEILMPGDTQADVNLPTNDDGVMVVYIIISFRSDTVSGGAISYLIIN